MSAVSLKPSSSPATAPSTGGTQPTQAPQSSPSRPAESDSIESSPTPNKPPRAGGPTGPNAGLAPTKPRGPLSAGSVASAERTAAALEEAGFHDRGGSFSLRGANGREYPARMFVNRGTSEQAALVEIEGKTQLFRQSGAQSGREAPIQTNAISMDMVSGNYRARITFPGEGKPLTFEMLPSKD